MFAVTQLPQAAGNVSSALLTVKSHRLAEVESILYGNQLSERSTLCFDVVYDVDFLAALLVELCRGLSLRRVLVNPSELRLPAVVVHVVVLHHLTHLRVQERVAHDQLFFLKVFGIAFALERHFLEV